MLSKKLQAIDRGYTTYRAVIGERYAIAWREEDQYHLQFGNMGMPADVRTTYDNIEALAQNMREFASLRNWSYYSE